MANYKYPDPFATNEQKLSKEYGLEYAKFIEGEWFGNGKFSAIRHKYKMLESFKDNEVDEDKYKEMLGMCDKRIFTGMNWTFTPIAPKFVNVIKDGFATDLFKIHTRAIDAISQKERNKYKRELENNMLTADFTRQISMATGTDYTEDYTPESEEEIDIHMRLKYKQPREIASEIIIDQVLKYNGWEESKNRIIEDIITKGFGAAKITPDKDYGVVVDRVVPEDMVYSYDTKSSRDKKGCFYFGEVKQYTPNEILRLGRNEISRNDLESAFAIKSSNDDSFNDRLINVLYFCYKTTISETYKRKRNNLIPKPQDFRLHEDSKSRVVNGNYDVWFEGYYILETKLMWGYRLMEDMVRPSHNMTKVLAPYVVYQLSVPSVIENIMPFCEDVHIAVLKLRQLIINAKPQGYEIDIDAISHIDIGTGGVLSPAEVLKIRNQTGDLLVNKRGFDEDEKDYSPALRNIASSLGADIVQLINVYNNSVNMCYEVSGLNRVRDGSAPLAGALVGTQQIALSMSNTATKHILNAILTIDKNVSEVVINRAQQLAMYGDMFAEEIMESFLEYDDKVKNELISSHKYRFDVIVEVAPDKNEQQAMEQIILAAVQSGQILLPDVIDLKSISNIKLAGEYLKILIKKRQKDKEWNERMMVREKEMARAQANVIQEQAKQQTAQLNIQEAQVKGQVEIAVNNAKVEKETEGRLIIEAELHKYRMAEKGLDVEASANMNKFKEDAKDNRTKIQADQQSRMISQRQNGTPPENFNPRQDQIAGIIEPQVESEILYDPNSLYGQNSLNESGQLTPEYATEEATIQSLV